MIATSKEVLRIALGENYESVIVFGFRGGSFFQHWSEVLNNSEKVGLLEEAKHLYLHRGGAA